MTKDMLDDLYDCLIILSEVKRLDEIATSNNELEVLDKTYNIIKHLYDKYTI